MKKLTSLTLMILLFMVGFSTVEADVYAYDIETYQDQGYDLTTGKASSDPSLSSTNKLLIGSNLDSYELTLTSLNFHHLLFFDKNNRYIGYVNGNETSLELERYLGYDASASTPIPETAKFFVIQNYDYDNYYNPLLDTVIYEKFETVDDDITNLELTEKPSKNLFNLESQVCIGGINYHNLLEVDTTGYYYTECSFTNLDANVEYTISYNWSVNNWGGALSMASTLLFYDSDNAYISETQFGQVFEATGDSGYVTKTFTTSSDTDYIILRVARESVNTNNINAEFSNFLIEEGSTATTYEPYVSDQAWADYQALTYRDVFGDSLHSTGKTNLIDNGDFSVNQTPVTSYYGHTTTELTLTMDNDNLNVEKIGSGVSQFVQYKGVGIESGHIYYSSFDIDYVESSLEGLNSFYYYSGSNQIFILSGLNDSLGHIDKLSYLHIAEADYSTVITYWNYHVGTSIGDTVIMDNYIFYDLTDLFGYGLEPSLEEFEAMLDYYELHVDAPLELTYRDVFGNTIYREDGTNLITNGDFYNGVTDWTVNGGSYSISDGLLTLNGNDIVDLVGVIQSSRSIIEDNLYYYDFHLDTNDLLNLKMARTGVPYTYFYNSYDVPVNTVGNKYAIGDSAVIEIFLNGYVDHTPTSGEFIVLGNLKLYDSTATFGATFEPTSDQMDTWLDFMEDNEEVDPYEDYYTSYYNETQLGLIDVSYNYTAPDYEPDVDSGIDEGLDAINMNSDSGKVFLSIAILIAVVIVTGLISRNALITMIVLGVTFILLTFLGWIATWVLVVATILLIILGLLRASSLGGGK